MRLVLVAFVVVVVDCGGAALDGAVRRGSRPRRRAACLLWLVARDAAGTAQVTFVREPLRLALDLACLRSPLSLDDNAPGSRLRPYQPKSPGP